MTLNSGEEYKKVTVLIYNSLLEGLETGDYRGIFERAKESLPENFSGQFSSQALTLLKSIVEDVLSTEYKDLPPFAIDRLSESSRIWGKAIEKCGIYASGGFPARKEAEKPSPLEEKPSLPQQEKADNPQVNLNPDTNPNPTPALNWNLNPNPKPDPEPDPNPNPNPDPNPNPNPNANADSNPKKREFRSQDIIENIPLGIVIIDKKGIIKSFNSFQERISQAKKEQMIGKQLFRMFPPGIKLIENVFKKGEPLIIENFKYMKEEGKEVAADIKIYPLKNSSGGISGAMVITEDINERKGGREEVAHSEKMLSAGELATSVAHGIGNPLTIISGNIQLLIGKINKKDPREKELKLIRKEVERCKKIVEALLEYSRLSKYKGRPINISKLIEEHSRW